MFWSFLFEALYLKCFEDETGVIPRSYNLTIKENLKKTKRNATIARIVISVIMLYFLMMVVKGFYFMTDGENFGILFKLNKIMRWIIESTYFPPFNFVWDKIPLILSDSKNPFLFYKTIIPPGIVMFICSLYINDYRRVKDTYRRLENTVKEEKELHLLRQEVGMHTVSKTAIVDININNVKNSDISWHNTWWGKIVIGISTAIITVIIGLK